MARRAPGPDRGVLSSVLQPGAKPGRVSERGSQARGGPPGAGAEQAGSEAGCDPSHAQAVEIAKAGPQLLPACARSLCRLIQVLPGRINNSVPVASSQRS